MSFKPILFAILIFLALLAGAMLLVNYLPDVSPVPTEALENTAVVRDPQQPAGPGGPDLDTAGAPARPIVVYSGSSFTPSSLTLSLTGTSADCFLLIMNKSSVPLLLRLSPHSPQDAVGFPYSPIPAGESGLIDPRYRQTDIKFHNHNNPEQEFSVILGKGCILE